MKNPASSAVIAMFCLIAGFLAGCVLTVGFLFDVF